MDMNGSDAGSDRVNPAEGALPSLVGDVLHAYRDFLLHQGLAASVLVRWRRASRGLDFAWLGGIEDQESLVLGGNPLRIGRNSELFDAVKRMHTTATLNPYEREVLYGYPFVIGRRDGKSIRGPLLTIPLSIRAEGDGFILTGNDENLRFNALPFRVDQQASLDAALGRLSVESPSWPTDLDALNTFVTSFGREFSEVQDVQVLDGHLRTPPTEPTGGDFLRMEPQAAIFVAPRSNYFLASDLDAMSQGSELSEAMAAFLAGGGAEAAVELDDDSLDRAKLIFPFPSNRAQRKIALLLDDPTTQVVRVEGPPGTGKSLTIANLACHLASTNRSVLITSQRDKALSVVDAKLRELDIRGFPMTLLRHDRDAKRELLERLADASRKDRASTEVQGELAELTTKVQNLASDYAQDRDLFDEAIAWEEAVLEAAEAAEGLKGIKGALARRRLRRTQREADRRCPDLTDEISERALAARRDLRGLSARALAVSAEFEIARASRQERQRLKELEQLLKRNQKSARNFHLFDQLKQDPERAKTLLRLLPVWIMSPDDVARLFPAESGLFDVVIVDEASQVDLPAIFPVLHRAKKLVVSGDTKQMQPKRFSFVAGGVAAQAWQAVRQHDDPLVELLDPTEMSLLDLAFVRAQEENLLDEHFRSLPSIIDFSNTRWYRGRLRIMTDERRKRFGPPDQPTMSLHHAADGEVSNGSQENESEARALVEFLSRMVVDPDYAGASIGVICLFAEQVELVQELVAESIDEDEWEEHDLVVVNPDGFQGDERDVILYSLSYDDNAMPRAAISARQQESPHVQGMLNVAFTRARDEVHVFHTADISRFFKEDGTGRIGEWLAHIAQVQERPAATRVVSRSGRIDSEFEAEVAEELRKRNVAVSHQHPACGFFLDLMCELNDTRVGVECDGPTHFDEHGRRRIEDLERLAILARAGWRIVNIPYRLWRRAPGEAIQRVLDALTDAEEPGETRDDESDAEAAKPGSVQRVSPAADALVRAIRGGATEESDVFRAARDFLGKSRLTSKLQAELHQAATQMNHQGLIVIEDSQYFLTPEGRATDTAPIPPPPPTPKLPSRSSSRRVSARKPVKRQSGGKSTRASAGKCMCGGTWVMRSGKYGKFYGCSRYPSCRRTRNA